MIPRHSPIALDLTWWDLAEALGAALGPDRPEPLPPLARNEDPPLVTLSVRTGFDLYLQAAALPPGSRVLVGAITHPDMLALLEFHGLVPVAVDLDPATMAPLPGALERAWSPDTVALLVTHLFGARIPLEPSVRFCRERGLHLLEDCAQAFTDRGDAGCPGAAVSLFSFGPLKTSTALGGALVYVRDPDLRGRMEAIHDGTPVQSRWDYLARVLRYAVLHLGLESRWIFGLVAWILESRGRQVMDVVRSWATGMPGPFRPERLRRRPSAGLVRMLASRLRRHDPRKVEERGRCGEEAARAMPSVEQPGCASLHRTWWIFPVVVDEPRRVLRTLEKSGFQAIPGLSNLVAADSPDEPPRNARRILERGLLVPIRTNVPPEERRRLAGILEGP